MVDLFCHIHFLVFIKSEVCIYSEWFGLHSVHVLKQDFSIHEVNNIEGKKF